jgi:hypothetical protein
VTPTPTTLPQTSVAAQTVTKNKPKKKLKKVKRHKRHHKRKVKDKRRIRAPSFTG